MDLYNNEIVAAKLYDHQQTPLVLDTLKAALEKPAHPKGVIIHSDQGSVYTSYAYQAYVMESNLVVVCQDEEIVGIMRSSNRSTLTLSLKRLSTPDSILSVILKRAYV